MWRRLPPGCTADFHGVDVSAGCRETAAGRLLPNSVLLVESVKMKSDEKAVDTIDGYIAGFPPDVQKVLQKVRATIRKAAPAAEEAIKYRIPTFILHGNLVHFAAFKKHVGFYPAPSAIEKFKAELEGYEGAKGSVQFPLDQPLPFGLITRIVKFRVRESTERAQAGPGKK